MTQRQKPLTIYLTPFRPDWALTAIAALSSLTGINVITTQETTEKTAIDIVLHFGHDDSSLAQHFGFGHLGLWFFRFNQCDENPLIAARKAAAQGLSLETSLWTRFENGHCECLYQSFGFLEALSLIHI